MERPDLCKGCEKHCCTRPTLTTPEYLRMFEYVGNEGMTSFEPSFKPEAGGWGFKSGCPASTPQGCIMPYAERPLICRLFPWMYIPVYTDANTEITYILALTAHRCPNWKAFSDNYDIVKKEFENG